MAFQVRAARYGIGSKPGESVDVTEKVRTFVGKNGLKVPRVSNAVLGLGAVFPGQRKRLWIDYAVDGKAGSTSVLERKSLRFPK